MLAAILSSQRCLATAGNLNNHLGVPLTLLRLKLRTASRSSRWGESRRKVAALVAVARPTIGLITNAGAEHLEVSAASMAWRAPKAKWLPASRPMRWP
jgi:UDP-N-acetylmuramoyl-tripeptide--D-alanyl-D-alanine ligase